MAAYGTLAVPTDAGTIIVDMAARVGDIAVTRGVDKRGWRLTHAPTGLAVPYRFPSAVVAKHCLRRLDEFVDWDGFLKTLAKDENPNCLGEVRRVAEECGGQYLPSPVTWSSWSLPILRVFTADLDDSS